MEPQCSSKHVSLDALAPFSNDYMHDKKDDEYRIEDECNFEAEMSLYNHYTRSL